MAFFRTRSRFAATLAGLVVAGTVAFSEQSIIGQVADWQFRHNATSTQGAWDIWSAPSGWIGATLFVNQHASPPDGQIVKILSFNNKADLVGRVTLVITGFDLTGMSVRLVDESFYFNSEVQKTYRDSLSNNTAILDATDRRLLAEAAASTALVVAKAGDKTVNTFRLPPPPTTYELRTGLTTPDVKLRLIANGASVAASVVLPDR